MSDDISLLQLSSVHLKNFRCFEQITVDLDSPIVLICGSNGTGKTSLLEALYYACYLRSFRTHTSRDLIALNKDSFFIKLVVQDAAIQHNINIGSSGNKRIVKIDNKSTVSYKDLLSHYRIISLTEDDLMLIKGAPEDRRSFVDQVLLLENSSFLSIMKEYRIILDQRNSLLQNHVIDLEAYFIWTKKLWEKTSVVQVLRKKILEALESEINMMLSESFDENLTITFSYQAKKHSDTVFDQFWAQHESLLKEEQYFKRTLFGVHLDDFTISLEGKKSRSFASRGQQKMIVLLIKSAQIKQLMKKKAGVIFLLDDFMTDFDSLRGTALLSLLFNLKCQLIFTTPHHNSPLEEMMRIGNYPLKKISV